MYDSPFSLEGIGEGRFLGIGAGYGEIALEKELGQSAHTDSTDTDEIHMTAFCKVYLIHEKCPFYFFLIPYIIRTSSSKDKSQSRKKENIQNAYFYRKKLSKYGYYEKFVIKLTRKMCNNDSLSESNML